MIIGITGLIGSGKSTASKILKNNGWVVVDADLISRHVVRNNKKLLKDLSTIFGEDIITSRGNLSRQKLAEKAFYNKSSIKKLNKLTHPYILLEIKSQLQKYKKENNNIVLDAPLLLDKIKYRRLVDVIIMIHASQDLRIKRKQKSGFSKKEILLRQDRQLSYSDYRSRSDFIVLNNGSSNALERKLLKVINKIL
jgi:dephospho-CoA kinase